MWKYKNSFAEDIEGVVHIYLNENTYYQNGYAYGKLLKQADPQIINICKSWQMRFIASGLYFFKKKSLNKIKVPKEYLDEIKGYSDATGVSFKFIWVANFAYDIFVKMAMRCSTFSFFNKSNTIVGHNTDMIPLFTKLCLKYTKPLVVETCVPGKNKFVNFSLPFMVGSVNGFNEYGISINTQQVMHLKPEGALDKWPTSIFIRRLLEVTQTLNDAENFMLLNKPNRALNIMVISSSEKASQLYQINAFEVDCVSYTNSKYSFCTTFFITPIMQRYLLYILKPPHMRYASLDNMLQKKDTSSVFSIKDGISILKDTSNGLKRGYSMSNVGTWQSFIYDLNNFSIYISNAKENPASLNGKFIKLNPKFKLKQKQFVNNFNNIDNSSIVFLSYLEYKSNF